MFKIRNFQNKAEAQENTQNGAESTSKWGEIVNKTEINLKNKANLFRIEYCVMRIAKRNLKKQSQSPGFGRKFEARNTKFETKTFFRNTI